MAMLSRCTSSKPFPQDSEMFSHCETPVDQYPPRLTNDATSIQIQIQIQILKQNSEQNNF